MENFPKEYEDVFSSEKTLRKCDLNLVSTGEHDISQQNYVMMFSEAVKDYQKYLFDHLVKLIWLMRQFHYRGKRRSVDSLNGMHLDGAFGVFMRFHVGYDAKIITRNDVHNKIAGYFDDFFPDFDINNPFESKYEYPYDHVSFEFLWFVHAMPERLELLAEAEKKKMTYSVFLDYVINYISVYNERNGDTYEHVYTKTCPQYIKYKKNEDSKSQTSCVRE